jgi:hypothetical protein
LSQCSAVQCKTHPGRATLSTINLMLASNVALNTSSIPSYRFGDEDRSFRSSLESELEMLVSIMLCGFVKTFHESVRLILKFLCFHIVDTSAHFLTTLSKLLLSQSMHDWNVDLSRIFRANPTKSVSSLVNSIMCATSFVLL